MKERKTVVQLIGSFRQGGSEVQALQLSKDLAVDGSYDVIIACLDKDGPLIEQIDWTSKDRIEEFPLKSFYGRSFLASLLRFKTFARNHRVDLIHTHDFYSNVFGLLAAKFAGVPIRIGSKRETATKTASQFFVERQVFRLAHYVVANAEAVRRFLTLAGVPSKKIVTIYNGVDLGRVADPTPESKQAVAAALDIPLDFFVVTIVANMHDKVKNHEMFLKAARIVLNHIPNSIFLLLGEGSLMPGLLAKARELGILDSCRFVGARSDIANMLHLSNVGVLCSRSEGFSNAIVEYMIAGLPVVATSVGGAAEAVEHEKSGFLVSSDDHESLAAHLIVLLADKQLATRLGRTAKESAAARFSSSSRLSATLDLYDSCFECGQPR